MKVKTLLAIGVCAALAITAQAELSISWNHSGGYWSQADGGDAVQAAGGDLLTMLIWSADGMFGAPTPTDLAGGGTVLLEGLLVADFGGSSTAGYAGYGATAAVGPQADMDPLGFVMGRTFDASSGIAEGNWYYDGPVAAVNSVSAGPPPGLPQVYDTNRNTETPYGGDRISTGQVIPEPATLALLGLGALTALWRRRR